MQGGSFHTSYSVHFSDQREAVKTLGVRDEDYCVIGRRSVALCDGVPVLHRKPYPDPSPGALAAGGQASSSIQILEGSTLTGEARVQEAFRVANEWTAKLNSDLGNTPENQEKDFIEHQPAGAVGIIGFLEGSEFYFGHINDCEGHVFDPQGRVISELTTDSARHDRYLRYITKSRGFANGETQHTYFRKEVVNKHIPFEDGCVDFGVLNGDQQALDFVRTTSARVSEGCIALFYSDGFEPLIEDDRLISYLVNNRPDKKDLEAYIEALGLNKQHLKEKTLAVIRF